MSFLKDYPMLLNIDLQYLIVHRALIGKIAVKQLLSLKYFSFAGIFYIPSPEDDYFHIRANLTCLHSI